MGEKVGLEVGALVERAIAHRTFVGRLLHVKDLVNCESPRLTETFTTLGTFKWFFLAVDVPAQPKIRIKKNIESSSVFHTTCGL